MELNPKEKEFLIGLEALTRKTGIRICGCGCCNSPFLEKARITNERSGYGFGHSSEVIWLDELEIHNWKEYANSIVKEI